MVRFKAGPLPAWAGDYQRFHPTMVRFKGDGCQIPTSAHNGFHPTMVRFKVEALHTAGLEITVSIPLWCDLKVPRGRAGGQEMVRFPSHYGAI